MVLMQILPKAVVGSMNGGGIDIPPPPPPPRHSLQARQQILRSVESIGEVLTTSKDSRQKATYVVPPQPPPPPPERISRTFKDNDEEFQERGRRITARMDSINNFHPESGPPSRPQSSLNSEIGERTKPEIKESTLSADHASTDGSPSTIGGSGTGITAKNKLKDSNNPEVPPPPRPPPLVKSKIGERSKLETKESTLPADHASADDSSSTPSEKNLDKERQEINMYEENQPQPQQNRHERRYQQHDTLISNYYPEPQHHLMARQQEAHERARRQRHSPNSFANSSGSSYASSFKGFWGKVERSLDDLADLENKVAGQAQKMVNAAISTASTASKVSPSTLRSLAQSGAAAAASRSKLVTSLGNQSRKIPPSNAMGTNVPLKPYGQKYEIAREAKQKEQEQQQRELMHPISNENNGKATFQKKIIASKGGATPSPYDYPPEPPLSPSSDENHGENVVASKDSFDATAQQKTERLSDNSNPYDVRWELPPADTERRYQSEPSPPTDSSSQQRPFRPEDQNVNRDSQIEVGHGPRSGSSINGEPIRKSARPQPRSEQQKDPRDPHSRSNRLPWDTSSRDNQAPGSSHYRMRSEETRPNSQFDERGKPSWKRALQNLSLPPLPNLGKLRMPTFRRKNLDYSYGNLAAWDATDKDKGKRSGGIFGFFKRSASSSQSSSMSSNTLSRNSKQASSDIQPPLVASMISRCDNGKSTSLLSDDDKKASKTVGCYKAALDVLFVISFLLGFKLLFRLLFESDDIVVLLTSWQTSMEMALPRIGSVLSKVVKGDWVFFAFLYSYLFKFSNDKILDRKIDNIASSVAKTVKEESEYAQLYLRLLGATPMDRQLPGRLASIAKTQVSSLVAKSRLKFFVVIVLGSLTIMTVSAVGPIVMAFCSAMKNIVLLEEWRRWPISWEGLLGSASVVLQNLLRALESQSASALRGIVDNPTQFLFHLSMFVSLIVCTFLPSLEERRTITTKTSDQGDPDEDAVVTSTFESAEEWSRLGTSSASRLSMLSENGSIETALARWRSSRITPLDESIQRGPRLSTIVRLLGYAFVAVILASSPLLVSYFLVGQRQSLPNAGSIFSWDSMIDLTSLQLYFLGLVYYTFKKVTESLNDVSVVKTFQADLVSSKQELEESNKSNAEFRVMGSVSPTAGVVVRDLWAAHATKRAWAVRGVNFQCKNGEILVVLGEDGNGKTRLLTTIAETLLFPLKRTMTTNKVRGVITIGGLDATKWDRKMLKRRLGIFLSDVRMVADSASLFSGWTMEEILEPVDGLRSSNNDPLQQTSYTKAERSAMLLALKITGLYKTLLTRLPSKTSTIFTANEEDLRPTSLKPRSTVLSPGEWSKLMFARILAQTIYDNDNALASDDKVENSLLGSILLLDEPTMMHSEVDEVQLYRDLRLTGAATVISTNKWATGRFADHICVVKNGAIVEIGNHNELLARGPQQSLYAAKWHAMTLQ
eukprot:CAMPEP_0197176992 /NCGR_PEP_ID=MMETSP1423-20130617/2750_1 /TAXON_ID=476441 /ORGANISM="Pseudo-nitzschia heimii, Strain UNC1101" /LENGTH=1458 /DNA_ID=CAMNT_0042626461 /DNA_START=273 /DNA_END=4649 /DNA_ORIENTATION=-